MERVESGVGVTFPCPQLVSAFQGSHRFPLYFFRRRQRRHKATTREGAVVTSGDPKGGSRNGYLVLLGLYTLSLIALKTLTRVRPHPLRPDACRLPWWRRLSFRLPVSLTLRKSNFHFSCCSLGWFSSWISPAACALPCLTGPLLPQGVFLASLSALGLCGLVHLGSCD